MLFTTYCTILDLFGKAKKKILKKENSVVDNSETLTLKTKTKKQEIDWGPQEIGKDFVNCLKKNESLFNFVFLYFQ